MVNNRGLQLYHICRTPIYIPYSYINRNVLKKRFTTQENIHFYNWPSKHCLSHIPHSSLCIIFFHSKSINSSWKLHFFNRITTYMEDSHSKLKIDDIEHEATWERDILNHSIIAQLAAVELCNVAIYIKSTQILPVIQLSLFNKFCGTLYIYIYIVFVKASDVRHNTKDPIDFFMFTFSYRFEVPGNFDWIFRIKLQFAQRRMWVLVIFLKKFHFARYSAF